MIGKLYTKVQIEAAISRTQERYHDYFEGQNDEEKIFDNYFLLKQTFPGNKEKWFIDRSIGGYYEKLPYEIRNFFETALLNQKKHG